MQIEVLMQELFVLTVKKYRTKINDQHVTFVSPVHGSSTNTRLSKNFNSIEQFAVSRFIAFNAILSSLRMCYNYCLYLDLAEFTKDLMDCSQLNRLYYSLRS